jgi:UDP-N-acetyl-D-mannosaminuronic acid dehydrogenase
METEKDVVIIGGCGRAGLPLGIALSEKGVNVTLYDIDKVAISTVQNGVMPFKENGADEAIKRVIGKTLHATSDIDSISQAHFLIITIGTPIDEYLSPDFDLFERFIGEHKKYFKDGQTIVLRSTVFPGTTEWLNRYCHRDELNVNVCFCPERTAEGSALVELSSLPQIISAFDDDTVSSVDKLFSRLTSERIVLKPIEAELAKLFTNSWRYIQFSVANQFFMLSKDYGAEYSKIYTAMTRNYPRAAGFPKAGFASGPCLFKDTMQLSAFSGNKFFLGHSAMLINEGMPNFIVQKLVEQYPLSEMTIGILGMAFKANSDDKRASLCYKMEKILSIEAKKVICSDEFIQDERFVTKTKLIEESDLIILGVPHQQYKDVEIPRGKEILDIWDFLEDERSEI